MLGRGYAERNLPSFFANSFNTVDLFKVDCKAEELTQGQHLVILMMNASLEEDSQTSSVLRVFYEPLISSTSEAKLLSRLLAISSKVFCSEQSSSRGGIEIAQLVADWLIRCKYGPV